MTGRHLSGLVSYGVTVDPACNVELLFFQPPLVASLAMKAEDAIDLAAGIERLAVIIRDDPEYQIDVARPALAGSAIAIWRSGPELIACAFGAEDGAETDLDMPVYFAQAWAETMTRVARVALVMRDDGASDSAMLSAMGRLN